MTITWTSRVGPAGLVLGVALALLGPSLLMAQGGAPAAQPPATVASLAHPLVVAVVPFDLAQGPSSYGWMRTAVPAALQAQLSMQAELRTIEPEQLWSALAALPGARTTPAPTTLGRDEARQVARSVGADVVVWGDVVKFGERVTLDVFVTTAAGGMDLVRLSDKDNVEELLPQLSRIGAEVVEGLGLPMSEARRAGLAAPVARDRYTLVLWGRGISALSGVGEELDVPRARENLEHALRIDPQLAAAWYTLGVCHLEAGEVGDATSAFYQAVTLAPRDPHTLRRLATLAEERGSASDALTHLSVLTQVNPDDGQAHLDMARALVQLDRLPEARTAAERATTARHATTEVRQAAWRLLAGLRARGGDLDGMARAWEELLKQEPLDREANLALAALATSRKEYERAASLYRTLREANRDDPLPPHFLGELSLLQREPTVAQGRFASEAATPRPSPQAWRYLARAKVGVGDLAGAEEALRQVVALDPSDVVAMNALAALQLKAGRPQEAALTLRAAVKEAPGWPLLHANLGLALMTAGDEAGAEEALTLALRLEERQADAHYHLGLLYAGRQELRPALAEMRAALAADPGLLPALYNAGVLLELLGEAPQAAITFEDYLRAAPKDPRAAALQAHISALRGG